MKEESEENQKRNEELNKENKQLEENIGKPGKKNTALGGAGVAGVSCMLSVAVPPLAQLL